MRQRLAYPLFLAGILVHLVLPLVAYTLGWGLSWLPAVLAYGLWLILCELALLRNIRLTWELAPDRETRYLGAALWLLFSPYYLELFVGQFPFATASLIFWAWLAWKQHQPLLENAAAGERHWTHRLGRFCREHAGDAFWLAAVLPQADAVAVSSAPLAAGSVAGSGHGGGRHRHYLLVLLRAGALGLGPVYGREREPAAHLTRREPGPSGAALCGGGWSPAATRRITCWTVRAWSVPC